jgi:hypothetical protein
MIAQEPDSRTFWIITAIASGIAVFFLIRAGVTRLRTAASASGSNKSYKEDLTALVESVRRYVVENSTIFLILLGASIAALVAWGVLTWIFKAKQQQPLASVEDLVLAIASGLVTALVVLFLTDYSAKSAQEREFTEMRNAMLKQAETFDELFGISAKTGLRIFPSIAKLRLSPSTIFQRYLNDGEVVRASSSAGHRWMALKANGHVSSDRLILPVIRARPCELRLLVHNPILEVVRVLEAAGHPSARNADVIRPILVKRTAKFSEQSVAACLQAQLSYKEVMQTLGTDGMSSPQFKIVIKVSPECMYSDFFVIQDRCVFAAYPMHSRLHQQALSVSVRDRLFEGGTGCPPNEIARSFVEEFDHFWTQAIDYTEFHSEYQSLIEELVLHRDMILSN